MPRTFRLAPALVVANKGIGAKNILRKAMRRYKKKKQPAVKRIEAIARHAVKKMAETKYVSDNYDKNAVRDLPSVWNLTNLLGGAQKFLPLIPRVTQGTDEYQRIGDTILPMRSLCTTLEFSYNDADLSGHQIKVEVWHGTTKGRKSWADQNPLNSAAFLDDGQGGNRAPTFSRETTMLPTDKRLVSFKKITFILSKTTGSIGGLSGTGNYSANGGKSFHKLNIYTKAPKKLKYLDGAAVYPTNFAPGFFINLSYVDGVNPANQAEIDSLVNITSRTHMHYQDV